MPLNASSRLLGVSVDEKVARLSDFIGKDLDGRTGSSAPGGCYLLIARSPDSPVAQALLAHASRLAAAGVSVRTVFSEFDPGHSLAGAAPLEFPGEIRLIRDPRLLAAHEQLVLGSDCTWIGDSMRREPAKRDAYERFSPGCVQTAALANRSFERIWQAAEPFEAAPSLASLLASRLSEISGPPRAPSETPTRQ